MNYEEARSQVEDGDLIAVRGRRGPLAVLTRLITRSPYTHTGIALWVDGGLWLAEINAGGNHMVPLSQIDQDFDVFGPPGDVTREAVRESALRRLRVRVGYDFVNLFRIAFFKLFGVVVLNEPDGDVCNEYSARIYGDAGSALGNSLPVLASPGDLCARLPLKLEVRG